MMPNLVIRSVCPPGSIRGLPSHAHEWFDLPDIFMVLSSCACLMPTLLIYNRLKLKQGEISY
jgi:hypothetical protein